MQGAKEASQTISGFFIRLYPLAQEFRYEIHVKRPEERNK